MEPIIPENKTGGIIGDPIIPPPLSSSDSGQREMEQKPEKIQQQTCNNR
jgi:hypothetical protein